MDIFRLMAVDILITFGGFLINFGDWLIDNAENLLDYIEAG